MDKATMQLRFAELEKLARAANLDPYDVLFLHVPTEIIYQVASYGLPTRFSHWSFGRVYKHQRTQGEMGYSKIYELILNNDPSYAFLDKNNTDTINLMIAAHCLAHSDFFKNNVMFKQCGETHMIQVAKRHAEIIDNYRRDYGEDEVDEWIDIALSMERHIDVYKGLQRERYPSRHVEYEERSATQWEDVVRENKKPLVNKVIKGIYLPPQSEKDLLWFLSEYANLEEWQSRIFEIVRRESYYFYPQYRTKIMNEGWASYWHAELMRQYAFGNDNDLGVTGIEYPLTSEEHLDFAAAHEKVVQPGPKIQLKIEVVDDRPGSSTYGKKIKVWNPKIIANPRIFNVATRINPYYVGFRIFRDIKERWDNYYKEGYMIDEWDNKVAVTINGDQKIRQVMMEEDDISFLRNYLTEHLVDELHLFAYGNTDKFNDEYDIQEDQSDEENQIVENKTIIVQSKDLKKVIQSFAIDRNNYGAPAIVIRRVDESGLLRLEHITDDKTNIDLSYAEKVLGYIWKVWGRQVELVRRSGSGKRTWTLTYDGLRFEVDHQTPDYPDCVENEAAPSSW